MRPLLLATALLLAAAPASAQDCNGNGRPDAADISPLAFRAVDLLTGVPGPFVLAVADLDADGDVELAVTSPGEDRVRVLYNAGNGHFTSVATIAVGNQPTGIVAASGGGLVLGDTSTVNLFIANASDDTVTVLDNDGHGEFSPMAGSPFAVGGGPTGLLAADFDGDMDLDLVTANTGSDTVTVLPGDGGGFLAPVTVAAIGRPGWPSAADINRDGDPDVFLAFQTGNRLGGLYGGGAGPFTVAAGITPAHYALGDFSGDGDIDAVVASVTSDELILFENPGAMPWTEAGRIPVADPTNVLLLDLDGDGRRDIAATSFSTDRVVLLRNLGGGAFADPVEVAVPEKPLGLAAGDLDRDGRRDLVVTTYGGGTVTGLFQQPAPASPDCDGSAVPDECEIAGHDCNANGAPDVCDLRAPGGFGAFALTEAARPSALAMGDLDGDGSADVAAISRSAPRIELFRGTPGGLVPHGSLDVGAGAEALVAADLDGDGDTDLATAQYGDDTVSVLRLSAGGTVADTTSVPVGNQPSVLVATDLDRDGDADLVAGNRGDATVTTLRSTGGTLTAEGPAVLAGGAAFALAAGDLDGDPDVIASTQGAGGAALHVLRNAGGTLAVEPAILPIARPDGRGGIALADLDSDGDADLLALEALYEGDLLLRVLRNDRPAFVSVATLPVPGPGSPGGAGLSSALVLALLTGGPRVADFDADGRPDVAVADVDQGGLRVFRNGGGFAFEAGVRLPWAETVRGYGAGDVDGDGAVDLAASTRAGVIVARARTTPAEHDCTHDGLPDVCEATFTDCNANALPDACELAAVDTDADGVPDCAERGPACGNCRDDDGDGHADLADDACASTPFTRTAVTARPARRRRPGRLALTAEIAAALADPTADAPLLTVTLGDTRVYCGRPALRRRRGGWRLAAPDGALRKLVVSVNARRARTRVRALLRDPAIAPAPGAAVSVALQTRAETRRTAGVLRTRGGQLVAP